MDNNSLGELQSILLEQSNDDEHFRNIMKTIINSLGGTSIYIGFSNIFEALEKKLRILAACNIGMSNNQVARHYTISIRTVTRIRATKDSIIHHAIDEIGYTSLQEIITNEQTKLRELGKRAHPHAHRLSLNLNTFI